MAYEFHYTPTGTGVISGKEVLEQTEDAINDLGNTAISGVQEALDKAEQALTNSENAVDDAQTALNTANNAEGVAIQAQTDVSNLSGTVTNIGNRVTTAEGNITNLQGRMTTAEGNITNLQGRMTTAETNIGNLQTAVSTAQATANSAQQTATTARQQSYVFRYSSTALTPSSTNSNTLLDNTDNLKVGDKVIDSSGVLFSITAIDTQNSTFTIGTALIDLAQDSNVVHKSGDETKNGELTASKFISNYFQSNTGNIQIQSNGSNKSCAMYNGASAGDGGGFWAYGKDSTNGSDCRLQIYNTSKSRYERVDLVGSQFLPTPSGEIDCGGTLNKWKSINGINPGALSLPDFSNAIDISGYITVTGGSTTSNSYTPPNDGYISVNLGRSSGAIGLVISNGKIETCVRENTFPDNHRECGGFIPVQKNDTVAIISCLADSIIWAYFIPCQGNV